MVLRTEMGALIDRFYGGLMGLDPDDLLREPCQLIPGEAPQTVIIGRCDCGIIGCGSVDVGITSDGEVITWTSRDGVIRIRFNAVQYLEEVH